MPWYQSHPLNHTIQDLFFWRTSLIVLWKQLEETEYHRLSKASQILSYIKVTWAIFWKNWHLKPIPRNFFFSEVLGWGTVIYILSSSPVISYTGDMSYSTVLMQWLKLHYICCLQSCKGCFFLNSLVSCF